MDPRDMGTSILESIGIIRRNGGHQLSIDFTMLEARRGVHRQSVQYLVDFLKEDSHEIRELRLYCFSLHPHYDAGLDILQDFFANDTKLTKVELSQCNFGSAQHGLRLLTAFQTNRSVTDLTIEQIHNLEGAALGACLSDLLENNSYLQRLACSRCPLRDEGVRAFQRGLRPNRHLKKLRLLFGCAISDEGLRLVADALVGNATLEELDIRSDDHDDSSDCLAHIARLLDSTQLKKLKYTREGTISASADARQYFARVLSQNSFLQTLELSLVVRPISSTIFQALERNTTLETLKLLSGLGLPLFVPDIDQLIESIPRMKGLKRFYLSDWKCCMDSDAFISALHRNTSLEEFINLNPFFYDPGYTAEIRVINTILSRNRSLNRAKALLALQPRRTADRTRLPLASKSGVWYKGMAKLAPDTFGASAIFHILQKRPALLERQLVRQQPHSDVSPQREASNDNGCNTCDNNQSAHSSGASRGPGRKRARPSD